MQPQDEAEQVPEAGAQPAPPQPNPVPPGQPVPAYGYPPPPAPGYAPPGYGPQQVSPQGYGYPPPGQQPPLGYGYAPPGYVAPRPAYAPPAQYHVPPTDGRPPEFVPPAEGTLFQAWRALALKPSRQNYVAWAGAVQPGWVRSSILAGSIITLAFGGMLFLVIFFGADSISTNLFHTSTSPSPEESITFLRNIIRLESFFFLLIPVFYVANVFAIPFGQAVFMPSALGTLRQRYDRAMKPWALAQVPLQLAEFVIGMIGIGIFFLVFIISQATGSTNADALFSSFSISSLLFFVLSMAANVYVYAQQLQSGSVGSGFNRWAVFGINLLTGFVTAIAAELVLAPFILIFFVNQITSFTTTPSGFLPFH